MARIVKKLIDSAPGLLNQLKIIAVGQLLEILSLLSGDAPEENIEESDD